MALTVLILVTLQRLSELIIASRNTRRLLSAGAKEVGASHYPAMVALHSSWLACLWIFGFNHTLHPWLLAIYIGLQGFRVWILATLGRRWTTRIITVPGEAPVTHGPYRLLRHPNYALVAVEVPLLPLVFGLTWLALVFGLLNLVMLTVRIRAEETAWRS